MGLDCSHDAWHGPYSQFHRWRVWLGKQIGLPFELCLGIAPALTDDQRARLDWFGDRSETRCIEDWSLRKVASDLATGYTTPIHLDLMAGHPLYPIFAHSDCDGRINWWDAGRIAVFLAQLLRRVPSDHAEAYGRMVEQRIQSAAESRWRGPIEAGEFPIHVARGCYDGMWQATKRFAVGCARAYRARERVSFR